MPRLALSLVCLAGAVFAACLRAQDGAERAGAWSPLARHGGSLRGLAVVDATVAWASGSGGAIWRTTDGGASWRNVAPREAAAWDFRDVEAWDGNRALAMVAGTPARVLRTDDGGASWRTVLADERKGAFFDAMAFAGDVGVLFGDPIDGAFSVWTTRDGGSTWKAVGGADLPAPLPGEAAFAASGSCVAVAGYPGAETFWIATGGGSRARMLRGAANGWTAIDLPLPAGAPSRGAFGQAWRGDRGIVVGGDYADTAIGGAACTSDGGRTWQAWPEFGGFRSAVAWVDDEHALAVGSHGETSLHFDRSTSSTDGAIGFHALAVGRDGAVLAAGADGRICRRSSQSRRPLRLARLFADHMVVPAATSVRVRGFATAGARVRLAASWGVAAEAMVANDGTFGCGLATPLEPGGPHGFTVSCGEERVEVRDVLAGDVWLASGQSNMEMQLGKAGWSAGIDGHEAAIAAADLPTLRVFTVTRRASDQPQDDCEGVWQVCTPAVAHEFSAVGFHFARALQQARQRPFGLVVSAWGGTVAEAWTSAVGLREFPEFAGQLAALRGGSDAPPAAQRAAFWRAVEAAPGGEFAPVAMPDVWSRSGLGGFDGAAEYRLVVTVPAVWAGSDCVLELGPIDDMDHATWDGERIGGMERDGAWATPRAYAIPGRLVTAGDHELRLRVADTSGEGGLAGPAAALRLVRRGDTASAVALREGWQRRELATLAELPPWPRDGGPNRASVLWNGMIAPLQPFPFAGAIWYQGESNRGRAEQYARLLPALVRDWRRGFGEQLAFHCVQIAPFGYDGDTGQTAELRAAQAAILALPNTGMAITLDVGDAADIHPRNKLPVGERLAALARARTYGDAVPCEGPALVAARGDGERAVLSFRCDGELALAGDGGGFELAGADGVFRPALARLVDGMVELRAAGLSAPAAVRYAWAAVPAWSLRSSHGLPAAPFRAALR
jgi:sialate O-acetylesterase